MRGEILQFDSGAGDGLISGDDGQRYAFTHRQLLRPSTLHAGLGVDFLPQDGLATEIVVLERPTPARITPVRQGSAELSPWGYFMKCLRLYVDGNGRARRSEYWWFIFFQALIIAAPIFVGAIIAATEPTGVEGPATTIGGLIILLAGVIYLGFILPGLCVLIRRLHDVGLSGWLVLLGLIPYLGGLVLFILTLLPSQKHRNEHGPVPGAAAHDTANLFS